MWNSEKFKVVVLGCSGGPYENNLSGYLVAPYDSSHFVSLDAGTLLSSIEKAHDHHQFHDLKIPAASTLSHPGYILRHFVKGYLISHAHLDHLAGLIINSPADSEKVIMGLDETIDLIRDHLFNGVIWPNFANEGREPRIGLYNYRRLAPHKKYAIPETEMSVEAFPLNHSECVSTAFLIESQKNAVLYFGDTSGDNREQEKPILEIWDKVSPLIQEKRLRGIFLECSYPIRPPGKTYYGHLDPKLMMHLLRSLATRVEPTQPENALKGFKVVVTHIKDTLVAGPSPRATIHNELNALNDLGIHFIFPEPGKCIAL